MKTKPKKKREADLEPSEVLIIVLKQPAEVLYREIVTVTGKNPTWRKHDDKDETERK